MEKGTYSDPRCYGCKPAMDNTLEDTKVVALMKRYGFLNPEGWREVDGVMLPPITWALQEAHTEEVLRKGRAE